MSANKRIIFLDIMRAFAVLMMVQGHTVDALLAHEYRTYDSIFYTVWITMRGFTAPIFMFTSGTVFTYLFKMKKMPFSENPRVIKGLKRFGLLVFIGYMLRYPTWRLFDFRYVNDYQWKIFFGVDALHLIGFGLLFIIILGYLNEKLKINYLALSVTGTLFFFLVYPLTLQIDWPSIFPAPVASYFTKSTGSLFPFFPWAGYVLAGSILGNYLAQDNSRYRQKSFAVKLAVCGSALIIFSQITREFSGFISEFYTTWTVNGSTAFLRLGIVLLFNSAAAIASVNIDKLPKLVAQIGTNTLLIYAVHLVILYGSAWNKGFYQFIAKQLNVPYTLLAVAFMVTSMILMVVGVEKFKESKKKFLSGRGTLADEKV